MNSKIKRITAFVIVIAAAFIFGSSSGLDFAVSAALADDGKNQLSELQRQIDEYDKKLSSMNSELSGLLERKNQIDEEIEIISQKMVKTNELIALYDDEIAEANIKIEEINKNIDVNYDLFKNWLQMTQLFGDLNPLEMIFSADSFIEFLENIDRVGTIMEYQNDVMDTLREDVAALSEEKSRLDLLKNEQLEVMSALKSDGENLASLREESENYISNLESDIDTYEALKSEVKEQEDALNAEIERQLREIAEQEREQARIAESKRIAESERAAEESRRAAESNAAVTSAVKDPDTEPETEAPDVPDTPIVSGDFLWPIADRFLITTTFGYERPGEVPHRGIDIPAPAGTAIRAAESGTVITAAKHSSYGNYVIISHGNGYATLYAHCTALYVSVGQKVTKGETIAGVGSTGYSSGNHLHFEVRLNGVLTDPLTYYDYMKDKIVIQIYK